jgi:hypothetical protein
MDITIVKDKGTKYNIQKADNQGFVLSEFRETKSKVGSTEVKFSVTKTYHPNLECLIKKMLYCQLDGGSVGQVLTNMDNWAVNISDQLKVGL